MKLVPGFIAIFLTLPIWFYLMYQMLVRVDASELMWFLYWIYVPAAAISAGISRMVEKAAD
jgi:hypothetical protein